MRSRRNLKLRRAMMAIRILTVLVAVNLAAAPAKSSDCSSEHPAVIERQEHTAGDGQGYAMTYCVPLPLEAYWRFKTNFDNDFLTSNPHITAHHFIGRKGDVVVTENRYAHNTKRLFRWQTVMQPNAYRLSFELQNPDDAGQEFHFGTIQLADYGQYTMVHQTAQFKFDGDALWAFYPWRGGMRSFLQSFVTWERQTALDWHLRNVADLPPAPIRQIYSRNWRHQEK